MCSQLWGENTRGVTASPFLLLPPTFDQRCEDAFVFASNDSSGTVILSHLQGKLPTEKRDFPEQALKNPAGWTHAWGALYEAELPTKQKGSKQMIK